MRYSLFVLFLSPVFAFGQTLHIGTWKYHLTNDAVLLQEYNITATYLPAGKAAYDYVISRYSRITPGKKTGECSIRYTGEWQMNALDDGTRKEIYKQVQEDFPQHIQYFEGEKFRQTYLIKEQGTTIERCECVGIPSGKRDYDMEDNYRQILLNNAFRFLVPGQDSDKDLNVFVMEGDKLTLRSMQRQ